MRWLCVLALVGCGGPEKEAPPEGDDPTTDTDSEPHTETDTTPDPTDTPDPTTDTAATGTTPASPLDGDGDGVSDAAELALTGTDPAVFDGGCLPWPASVVYAQAYPGDETLQLGDLDGDGDLDALATESSYTLFWYENLGGAFGPRQPLWIPQIWIPYYGYSYTPRAEGMAIADLDGDGIPDIVASVDGLWELRGLGGGAFAEPRRIAEPLYEGTLSTADIDGDGDLDVVGPAGFHQLAWFENQGAASFPEHLVDARDWQYTAPADIDGDGDVDLFHALFANAGDVGWYENLGAGASWTLHPLGGFGGSARSLAVGDLDADGDPDLAATGTGPAGSYYDMLTWENLGGGAMSPEIPSGASRVVAIADIDADGDADVVGTDGSDIAWFVSEGGTFAPRAITADLLEEVHAADLDGDGRAEVVGEPGFTVYANPLGADTDGDGLTDDAEACILLTDPVSADSDGDGFDDGTEVGALKDPSDAAAHP